MKICAACSAGGHLTEMLMLADSFKDKECFYVTAEKIDTVSLAKNERVFFVIDFMRNPLKMLLNIFQTLSVMLRERPDVIISTGGGIAIPACYIGKLMGKKVIFVEGMFRVDSASLSGKFAYPIADLFLVQWRSMLSKYGKKANYWGSLI